MASTAFNTYSVILDPTPGTALATPVWSVMPMTSSTEVQVKSATASSNVIMPNASYGGDQITSYWPEGTNAGQVFRDSSFDYILRSIMDSTYTLKVMTEGSTMQTLAYEKKFTEGSTTYFRQARGCQHTKLDIKWDADGAVEYTSDWVGINDARPASMITGATYSPPSSRKLLVGTDVTVGISGSGLSGVQLKKGSISIEVSRKPQTVCGSTAAVGLGTSGARKITYSLSFFRRDWTWETGLITGSSTRTVTLTMGATNTGYTFVSPVTFSAPMDEDDESGTLVTISGVATGDPTTGALTITQL